MGSECFSGLEHGKETACLRAGTPVRPGVCVGGDPTRAEPRLVQCSVGGIRPGVFVGGFHQGRTQPNSGQRVRGRLNSVSGGLNEGRTPLSSGAGNEFLAQDCLSGA